MAPPGLLPGVLILEFEALGGLWRVPLFPDAKEGPEAVLRRVILWSIALKKDLLSETWGDDKTAAEFERVSNSELPSCSMRVHMRMYVGL